MPAISARGFFSEIYGMKKGYVALLWSLWIGLIACDKEEAVITDTNQVNQWIEETMRTD